LTLTFSPPGFGLQIGVRQAERVQKGQRPQGLLRKALDVLRAAGPAGRKCPTSHGAPGETNPF